MCFAMSAREEIGKRFLIVMVDVSVEYFVNEYVSWDCVEGLTYVYGCYECSVCWFCSIRAFECCLSSVCEECARGVFGPETMLCGG